MAAHSVNENVTKDGRVITCEWFNTPLMRDDGEFAGLLCLGRDVTGQKSLEKVHFLQKPLTPAALAHRVREVLDSPE